jgi:hypothetical protein
LCVDVFDLPKGLLDLQCYLHNPFGDRESDVPHEMLLKSLRDLAIGLANDADKQPAVFYERGSALEGKNQQGKGKAV